MFAKPYVLSKQSLSTILCQKKKHSDPKEKGRSFFSLLLPKLQRYFAEFLQEDSLKRLSILYLYICVELGYGVHDPQTHRACAPHLKGAGYFFFQVKVKLRLINSHKVGVVNRLVFLIKKTLLGFFLEAVYDFYRRG